MSPKETLLDVGRLFVRTGKSKDRKMSLAAPDGAGTRHGDPQHVTNDAMLVTLGPWNEDPPALPYKWY